MVFQKLFLAEHIFLVRPTVPVKWCTVLNFFDRTVFIRFNSLLILLNLFLYKKTHKQRIL